MKYFQYALLLLVLEGGATKETKQLVPLVEICNNGLDDDQDGLIDLNDDDCDCPTAEARSLIPNPSFEEQECCPNSRSQMHCATTWIQASGPTTDYIHTCGWTGWEDLPMPLPIPDGEGAIGFRDGRFAFDNSGMNTPNSTNTNTNNGIASPVTGSSGDDNPNWKEYTGACLLSPLKAGISYKFQFHIGFTQISNSPPISVTFFGTGDCENLPFGNNDDTFGCPTNGPGWSQLGAVFVNGNNEWKQVEINVVPSTDIYAIAIGPPCQRSSATFNPYYFFDNLVLAEQSAFEFDIQANDQPCSPTLALSLPDYDTLAYQWYKDGIALLNETNSTLQQPKEEGAYTVVMESKEGCKVTTPFFFKKPVEETAVTKTICKNEPYLFNNQPLTEAGMYWDTLSSSNHCDSIIQLELMVNTSVEATVQAKIFPTELFNIGNSSFNQPGDYTRTIASSYGCDSTVHLNLDYYSVYIPNVFSPNGDGINDFFTINGGTDLEEILHLQIIDRWGNLVFEQGSTPRTTSTGWNGRFSGQIVPEGVYIYQATLKMDDGKERVVPGMVTVIR